MKTISIICFALLVGLLPATAQQDLAPSKEIVIVDFFSRIREVPAPYAQTIRGHVLQAFTDRGRHLVLDAEASRELSASVPGSELTTPLSAEADMAAFLDIRASQALAIGARYLISGTIAAYKFEHTQLPPESSGKPPRQGFKATFRVVVSGLDLKLGERMPDQIYDLTASAPAAMDADMAALARIRSSLAFYIDNHFKIESRILELCPPDKKGRVRELYIHSGTQTGVKPGDLFLVYEELPIGGVMSRQKIGRLRVNDVQNPDVARCKISKGDEQIVRAFAAGHTLICISDGKALFY